jgi:hypothetical protein
MAFLRAELFNGEWENTTRASLAAWLRSLGTAPAVGRDAFPSGVIWDRIPTQGAFRSRPRRSAVEPHKEWGTQ